MMTRWTLRTVTDLDMNLRLSIADGPFPVDTDCGRS